jgi:hypothetical protein
LRLTVKQTRYRRGGDIIELLDFDGSYKREVEARQAMKEKRLSLQVMMRGFHDEMGFKWKAHYEIL